MKTMRNFVIIAALLLFVATAIEADLLDCDELKIKDKLKDKLKDIPGIGPKIASEENISGEHEVRDFFKNIGCKIKEGAAKVSDGAKKFGSDLKEGAKNLGEKAKDLGNDIKIKFNDFKDKLSKDSKEEASVPGHHRLLESVEIINPDILRAEQQCGHGHILDALGNCSKLRK